MEQSKFIIKVCRDCTFGGVRRKAVIFCLTLVSTNFKGCKGLALMCLEWMKRRRIHISGD
jgi:hypothetical protein